MEFGGGSGLGTGGHQSLCHFQCFFGLFALAVGSGVVQIALRRIETCARRAFVNFGQIYRFRRQHSAALGRDLGKAAADKKALFRLVVFVDFNNSRPHGREQQGVARKHTEIALGAGDDDKLDIVRKNQLFRRDQLELECICNDLSYPSY